MSHLQSSEGGENLDFNTLLDDLEFLENSLKWPFNVHQISFWFSRWSQECLGNCTLYLEIGRRFLHR